MRWMDLKKKLQVQGNACPKMRATVWPQGRTCPLNFSWEHWQLECTLTYNTSHPSLLKLYAFDALVAYKWLFDHILLRKGYESNILWDIIEIRQSFALHPLLS